MIVVGYNGFMLVVCVRLPVCMFISRQIRFGIAYGQISSIFGRVIFLLHNSDGIIFSCCLFVVFLCVFFP